MRWKYRKLLSNLGNAVEALCGVAARGSGLAQRARREALDCFKAAGIGYVADDEEDAARLEHQVQAKTIDGAVASWRIVMAEPRAAPGHDRDRLPERGNRPAGPAPRCSDAGQRHPAVLVAAGGARAQAAGQRESGQDSDCARSSTESTAVGLAVRQRSDRSASRAASATRTPESQSPRGHRARSSVRRARKRHG